MPHKAYAVAIATPVVLISSIAYDRNIIPPVTITLSPGVGGSLTCHTRTSATAQWDEWPAGTVTAQTTLDFDHVVQAIKITATTANGVVHIATVTGDLVEAS